MGGEGRGGEGVGETAMNAVSSYGILTTLAMYIFPQLLYSGKITVIT